MSIPGLKIIGESINDSVPSTHKLYEAHDLDGIVALAKFQDEKGAHFIDVNVGRRDAAFMTDMVRRIQAVTAKPLSIDTPDPQLAEAGLKAYDPARAGGCLPILNSISPLRLGMFDLLKTRRFMPILMISERVENGEGQPNRTAEETASTAKQMLAAARAAGLKNEECIFDPGIAPIGGDTEGNLKRLLDALKLMRAAADFHGTHVSVGLSNFTVMLPAKRADGSPVKSALESAFLTLAMPLGLDMIIGSVTRKYDLLKPSHPARICLQDVLGMDPFEGLMRIKEFYS
ncbi:MAG: dihydropteroate synthase [Verrucomicrobiae bacterium]|nr:dihydropteroate synthase [Verrucomicrobiae bacterium]